MTLIKDSRLSTVLKASAAGFTAPIAAVNVYGALVSGFATPTHGDAAVYYAAAVIGLRYGWAHLYDLSKQAIVWPELHIYQTTWVQSPIVAWIFAPLTALSIEAAYLVWAPVMLAMILITWWLLALGDARSRIAQLMAVLALWAVGVGIAAGQLVFLVGACVAVAWWLLGRARPVTAGLVLALAIALKPQSASLVPLALLLAGYRKAFVASVAGAAVLGIAVVAVSGPDGTLAFLQRLREASTQPSGWNSVPGMTFAGIFGAGLLASALQVLSAAACLWIAYRKRARGPELPIASGIVGSHLLTPYLHEPEIFMLVIAAWMFARAQPDSLSAAYPVLMWIAAELAPIPSVGYAPLLLLEVLWLGLMFGSPGRVPSPSGIASEFPGSQAQAASEST